MLSFARATVDKVRDFMTSSFAFVENTQQDCVCLVVQNHKVFLKSTMSKVEDFKVKKESFILSV